MKRRGIRQLDVTQIHFKEGDSKDTTRFIKRSAPSSSIFTSERARRRASQWIMVVRSWRRGSKSSCPNHLQILADMAILMEYIVVRYEKL